MKEELASLNAVLLGLPDRWVLVGWACQTQRAHLETRLAWRGVSLSGPIGAQRVDLHLQVEWG